MVRIKGRGIFALLMIVFLLAPLSSQAAESPQPSTQRASEEELVKQTENQYSTPGVWQCGKTGIWLGLAVAFSGATSVSHVGCQVSRVELGVASNLEVSVLRFQVNAKVFDPDTRNLTPVSNSQSKEG